MGGAGVSNPKVYSYPSHNPRPYTERGKRRHANRSESEKNRAEKSWEIDRSKNQSRYQKMLGRNVGKGDF